MDFLKEKNEAIGAFNVLTMVRQMELVKGYPRARERKMREIFSVYSMPLTRANVEMLFERSTDYSIVNNMPIIKGVSFEQCESIGDFISCCNSLGASLLWKRVIVNEWLGWR